LSHIRQALKKSAGEDWHQRPRLMAEWADLPTQGPSLAPAQRIGFSTRRAQQDLQHRLQAKQMAGANAVLAGISNRTALTAAALLDQPAPVATLAQELPASQDIWAQPVPQDFSESQEPAYDFADDASDTESVERRRPSSFGRFVRRIKRALGMRTGMPAPQCAGFTKAGVSCKAPAMANGLCRQHGGSREATVRERLTLAMR
jgi:hypothetical protein